MSADEPLEDDPWQEPVGWDSMPRANRIAMVVGGSILFLGFIATGLVGWFRVHNVAWLAYWTSAAVLSALLLVATARSRRVQIFISQTGRGEYRGPFWLGAELERKSAERRRRILSERADARARQNPASPGDAAD